jgi:hypothetical protein
MSKKLVDGVWVIECDWKDPKTGEKCSLGLDGEPAQFVDPGAGKKANTHFQCGRHHGVVPQDERPEFQLPEDHKLNTDVLKTGTKKVEVEEVEEDE